MTIVATEIRKWKRSRMVWGMFATTLFFDERKNVDAAGRTDEELAAAGIDALEAWMREIGCVMSLAELGATEDMVEGIADATFVMEGGYHVLTRDEIVRVLRASL